MVSSSIRRQPDANSKRSGQNGQRLMYGRVTAIISFLVICIIVCLSWAVNPFIDNAITYKAQRDKNARELKLANALLTTCRCVSVVLRSMQNTGTADAKAENDALRDDVAAGRRGCTSSSLSISTWSHHRLGSRICPPAGEHLWTGLFTLEKVITIQKPLEEPSILMSSADRVAHISGQLMQLLWAIHTRFQRV